MKAERIRQIEDYGDGEGQVLWKLDPEYRNYGEGKLYTHVVTSAFVVLGFPETYVFPAKSDGEIINWTEMPGSFKGGLDHDEAIAGFLAHADSILQPSE